MARWNPSQEVINTLQGEEIRGHKAEDLFNESKFYTPNWFWNIFGRGGITWSKSKIIVSDKVVNSTNFRYQAVIIYHELVHVAQQKDWGWIKFMAKYVGEWIKSGFSYEKMKGFGIEKEAYDADDAFGQRIGYWG